MMPSLGSLEEIILLLVLSMKEEAYGVSVAEKYQEIMNKSISIPSIHTVLKRLEEKGFLVSSMGGATQERGGRKKRLYEITRYGYQSLVELQKTRNQLWGGIPNLSFN
ncbi:MAG: PadR family transcriptional regulator [Saprospiraceae bacterium]